jgi:type IV secretory pathway VirB10-like protein
MRWLIAALGLGVIALGVWLLASLRGRYVPPAPPSIESPPAARTIAPPPERMPPAPPPGMATRPAIAPPAPDAGHVEPPAPQRQDPRASVQDRLDRERRQLEEARAAADAARGRPNADPGEVRATMTRVNELERQVRADEIRLEKSPP